MRKHIWVPCVGIVVSILMLAGCGAESVQLTEEDARRVADYSSDVVNQHNDKSDSRLVDIQTVKRKYQEQLDLEVRKQNYLGLQNAASDDKKKSDSNGDGDGDDDGSDSSDEYVEPDMSLSEAIGVPEFDIYYTGYEVSRSYPSADSISVDDVYMGMTAAPGDTFVIMHFNISNTEGLDRECYILGLRPTFRVKINGENHTIQQTILSEDLSKYDGTIPAYSSADAVLICEISEGSVSSIDSLSLIVRSAEGRPEYKLE